MAFEKFDKDGDGTRIDDNLRLLCGARRDIGQCPGSLKLDEGMRRPKELNESGDDAGVDYSFDGWVAFLRKQFPELGCSLDLSID